MKRLHLFFIFALIFIRRRYKFLLLTSGFILILVFSIFSFRKVFIPIQIVEGVVGTYDEKNLPDVVSNLITTKFVEIDEKGLPSTTGLTEGWEATSEAKEYIFKIKKDKKWSVATL